MTDSDEPGGRGERPKPHRIVRPYVLSSGDSTKNVTRGRPPALDWPDDLDARRTPQVRPEAAGRDAPVRPRPATPAQPTTKSAGSHRALPRGWRQAFWRGWPGLLTERRWLAAIGAVAVLAIVGGMIFVLSRPSSRLLAGGCTTTGCGHRAARTLGRNQPPASGPGPARTPIRSAHPTATHSTTRPTPTPTASPTLPPVQVSYAVVRQHPHSFEGQVTIVNKGSTPIDGWELVVVLPGDNVRSVSDALFRTNGDTVYIDPPSSQPSIGPGASLTVNITAHGSTTALTSCTFNGSAC